MINLERLDSAIAVMKRAGKVDMTDWSKYIPESYDDHPTEEKYHACGTAACFAGWLAVSPEFQKDGGRAHFITGEPCFDNHSGGNAIIKWLEADGYAAVALQLIISGSVTTTYDIDIGKTLDVTQVGSSTGLAVEGWDNWTAKDVIESLQTLKGNKL